MQGVEEAGRGQDAAQPGQHPQVAAVFHRADQEEHVGQRGAPPPKGMPLLVHPSAKSGWLRIFAIGRRGCNSATPFSSAVVCMSSRAFTASAISLASQSQPVCAASSTIESMTELRVRAQKRHGDGLDRQHLGDADLVLVLRRGRTLQDGLDLEQLRLVRQPDPLLEPVVDVGLGKPPLAGHLPPRQLAPLRQLDHLLGGKVQVAGQAARRRNRRTAWPLSWPKAAILSRPAALNTVPLGLPYSMPSLRWICSSETPLVSGMTNNTQSNCRTIIAA